MLADWSARVRVAAVLLLALATLGLATAAVRHHPSPAAAGTRQRLEAQPPSLSSPGATRPSTGVDATAVSKTRDLLDLSGTSAVAVTSSATCTGPPASVSVSHDGGRTWQAGHAPAAYVLRVHLTGVRLGFAVAAGNDCKPQLFTTGDGGATWSTSAGDNAWYLAADGTVHAPGGVGHSPCRATAVSPLSGSSAFAACGSTVERTYTTGKTWTKVGAAFTKPVIALSYATSQRAIAALDGGSCAAIRRTADGGLTWRTGPCVTGAPVALAISATGNGLLVTGGGHARSTWSTTDYGATWQALP